MHVVISGSGGQLGRELMDVYREQGHRVTGFDMEMDIRDYELMMEKIPALEPELVVNSAAYTDTDGSETNPELAYGINFVGAQNLALACLEAGCPLVSVSTDYVFDGHKGSSYNEFDEPCPVGVYGKSKLASERFIASVLHRYYIFRTQWLFGKHGKRDFVKSIILNAREKGSLKVVSDEVGSPTQAGDLARLICLVSTSGKYGIYHATNQGFCSRFEFACEILDMAGMKDVPVERILYKDLGLPCPRPPYSPLENLCLGLQGFPLSRHYSAALKEYVEWLFYEGGL